MQKQKKILTLITVVYNDPQIELTIKSVIPFLNDEVEYVVIDGGSTDRTLSILKQYESYFAYWVSEKDNGIYDAMNKAIRHAQGHFVLHLNSGDVLQALPIAFLMSNVDTDILSFPVSINNGEMIYSPHFDWRTKFRTSLHHQGTFYKRELVSYDTSYKVFADFDLNQRLYKKHCPCICFDSPVISIHLENGISARMPKRRVEYQAIIKKNFGLKYCVLFYIYLVVKNILRHRY